MSYLFTVAGAPTLVLDQIANQLREQISSLPPDAPQLAKQELGIQAGVVDSKVVRGNESLHTHPESDLISVLEGGLRSARRGCPHADRAAATEDIESKAATWCISRERLTV